MSTIHLTNGDAAADALRDALRRAGRNERVLALKDDLAVGPLRGIDDAPDTRVDFWQRVYGDTERDFSREFDEQATALAAVVSECSHIVVWHAQSAADQLMLRRVCYHLRDAPQRLNEVRLSIRDLTDPGAWAHSRKDQATAVGMFAPDVLEAQLACAAPISVLRISRLALEWQDVKHANGETRRWRDNVFASGTFGELDTVIIEHAGEDWRPAARIAAQLMTADMGFLVSDRIALWRFQELAAADRIQLRGDAIAWSGLELCLTRTPRPATLSTVSS
ncbi:DUF1835 domain-containing protein [Paraburkholderia gardini]|jgi:hypothetical protein|uniref:DUF1835 domain-containing protein n=1 Tax=Paraburkholderia gardini TaxID=2823469 RepID=A0ABN7QZ19_9BURK|nr:DUF1835 domain-containing protein [Paraburkholderia gardini]CAG4926385.1 hypothetical protein R54767_05284 [Paraburkholderia gardini]